MKMAISRASIRPQCTRHSISCSQQPASKRNFSNTSSLNATLLRRPKRPYTFTQLVTLSDGSTFIHRTTSPMPVYKSNKDMRNTTMWNPSSQKLLNVEEDEAGRLRAFRERFGRGWDSEITSENEAAAQEADGKSPEQPHESLMDLISGYGKTESKSQKAGADPSGAKAGKGKDGKK